ncbi:hypothetical protein SAMN05444354_105343 [Stigmatella aurantiaca]|uniref:Uncharacterized protein n=1 Tax=Stigmatella aurantiaca TaxID=41 RepID=A0A1H7PNM2_STIAU|nr:hypothetical protein [Stigmatella aurantiaca]SEL36994.1 hypothetical protein SAMN05444354_105343 [Stigmatella aurantiaca]
MHSSRISRPPSPAPAKASPDATPDAVSHSNTPPVDGAQTAPVKPNALSPEPSGDAYVEKPSGKPGNALDLKGGPSKPGTLGGAKAPPRFSYAKPSGSKVGGNKAVGEASTASVQLPFNTRQVSPGDVENALWGMSNIQAAAKMPRAEFFEKASEGIKDFPAYAQSRYGELAGPMLGDMERLNTAFGASKEHDFRKLLIDPGVMSEVHRGAFCEFALKNQDRLAGKSPFAIRQEFSQQLGQKTYYRALKLTPDVASKISNEAGMTSRAFRSLDKYGDLDARIREGGLKVIAGDNALPNTRELADAPLKEALTGHIRPFSRSSVMRAFKPAEKNNLYQAPHMERAKTDKTVPASKSYEQERSRDLERLKDSDAFLSVSEDKRVALSVATNPDMAGKLKEGEGYYLFEVKLSPLDVVDPSSYTDPANNPKHVVFGGDTAHPVPYDAKIEGVVVGHIHASELASMQLIDLTDPALQASSMKLEY